MQELAYQQMAWFAPNTAAGNDGTGRPIDTIAKGIPSEPEYKKMYEAAMGIQPIPDSTWKFVQAFQIYRLSAIGHGVFGRAISACTCFQYPFFQNRGFLHNNPDVNVCILV